MDSSLVRAIYKTGVYIAELMETQEEQQRALVKVQAVLKHPQQGDLHNPKMVDVPLFHQRKALAQYEKAWVPLSSLKSYEGEELSYHFSLQQAWEKQYEDLHADDSDWAKVSIKRLEELKAEYGF